MPWSKNRDDQNLFGMQEVEVKKILLLKDALKKILTLDLYSYSLFYNWINLQ